MPDPYTRLERLLWEPGGGRRLPSTRSLDAAIDALPRGGLWRFCEGNARAPLYLLPTREWIEALGRECATLGRRVLEVAAGDGFVSRCLARARPDLEVVATDSGAWTRPRARMTAAEAASPLGRRARGLLPGPGVLRLEAVRAVRRFRPDVVLAVWLPPGSLLGRLVGAPCRYVLEVGAPGGVTAGGARDLRLPHAPLDGPVARLARCRLDAHPRRQTHDRVTLYRGARA